MALGGQVSELKVKVEATEKEREFYFEKLRDIEVLCQLPAIADLKVESLALGPLAASEPS